MNRLAFDTWEEMILKTYHLLPLKPFSKVPCIPWANLPSSLHDLAQWLDCDRRINIAVNCGRSRIVALDADSKAAIYHLENEYPDTPMKVLTPRGGQHWYYQAPEEEVKPKVRIHGIQLDIRAGMSYVVSPPSYSGEHKRRWELIGRICHPQDLPILPAELVREKRPEPYSKPTTLVSRNRLAVRRWISHVFSVSGSGGHNQCYRAACKLADAGLNWNEAWEELCLWNSTNADPPWSEKELRHKLTDAFRRRR